MIALLRRRSALDIPDASRERIAEKGKRHVVQTHIAQRLELAGDVGGCP